ncbi:LysE family translocator, partial [Thioclava sp. BHET1]
NNLLNLNNGLHMGFRRALPYAFGTALGLAVMVMLIQLGLGSLFTRLPLLHRAMQILTGAFLLYLAWKIANAGPIGAGQPARALGFGTGFAFQWINPKTWASLLTLGTAFLPAEPDLRAALLAALIFAAISLVSQPIWIRSGAALQRLLSNPRRARTFNITMAVVLLATTLPVLAGVE